MTYGEDANIPEGSSLVVTEIEKNSAEYQDAKDEIITAKKAKDPTFSETSFRMAALDISIVDANGKPVEPAKGAEVTVSFALKQLPAGAGETALYDTMEIQHLKESRSGVIVEKVADANDITVVNGSASAEFTVDSFSTFALTWTDGSATIHWGTIENGTFNEFDAASLDTAVGSIELRASYSGYEYVDAVYYPTEPTTVSIDHSTQDPNRTFINDVITKETATGGSSAYHWLAEDAQNNAQTFSIANGGHIYAVYQEPDPTHPHPVTPPGSQDEIPTPTTGKHVTPNKNNDGTPDGTYTIELDITGAQIKEEHKTGANVVLIFDNSNSMITNSIGNRTRLAVAQDAMETLIETLNPGTNDLDMSLVYFGTTATTVQYSGSYWTKNGSNITTTVNGLTASGQPSYGTNWHQALQQAYNLASNPPDDDPTYVIFITDGCPSVNSFNNNNDSHGAAGTNNTSDPCYTGGLAYAKAIAGTKGTSYSTTSTWRYNGRTQTVTITENGAGAFLYGIYTGTDNTNLLNTLISSSGGVSSITATSEEAITAAFKNIAQTIVNSLGATGVTTTDGVTQLSSVSADVHGAAGAFEYYRRGGKNEDNTEKYDHTANGGLGETWTNAPGAIYNEDGSVTWDLSSIGQTEAEVTYVLRFTVWPSQDAYDIIADLNNRVVDYDDLSDEIQAQIYESGGKYYLKTNTTLNTSYTFQGTTYTDPVTFEQGQMVLDETTMNVKKAFAHDINAQDPYTRIEFYLLRDGKYYQTDGTTSATLDESKVYKMPVNASNNWTNSIYIAPGVMKDGNVLEFGHRYSLDEKILAGNEYEYEFTPQTVRPMEINGSLKTLVLVDKYNPAPSGATVYYINDSTRTYQTTPFDGAEQYYVATGANDGALIGTNRKTAELDITKQIVDRKGNFTEEQLDAETFTYRVTLTTPKDADVSGIIAYEYVPRPDDPLEEGRRYYIFGYQSGEDTTVQGNAGDVSRFSGVVYGGYTVLPTEQTYPAGQRPSLGEFFVTSGDTKSVTLDITLKRNEIIRFTNLPADTQYTIVEMYNNYRKSDPSGDKDAMGSTMAANIADAGYVTTVATKSRNPVDHTVRTGSVEGTTVTGTIDYLDVRYYNQFTNTIEDAIDVELTGEKVHDGYNWTASGASERYYFNLSGEDADTPLPVIGQYGRTRFYIQATEAEVGTATTKSYTFGKIRFTEAGTYTYTIAEDNAGTIQAINGTAVQFDTAKTVTVTITKDETTGKMSASVTGTDTTWDADNLKATTTITNTAPSTTATATKAWLNADGSNTPPAGAKVTFTLYADGTATDKTVELDGTVDEVGEAEAWIATFSGLQKYKVVDGQAVEIVYTIGETGTWRGYKMITSPHPVASGGTITNQQNTFWVQFKKTDMAGGALSGAKFTFDPGTGTVALISGSDGIMATEATDSTASVNKFELAVADDPYVLAETLAPPGFLNLNDVVNVYVKATGVSATVGSTTTEYEVTGEGTEEDPYLVTITNTDGKELPNAGGPGTLLNYLGGAALLLTAAVMYGFRMRRRERRYN